MRAWLLLVAACSSSDTAPAAPDAEPCIEVSANVTGMAHTVGPDTYYVATLPEPPPVAGGCEHSLLVDIHTNRGVFAFGGFAPGTYVAETNPMTCGLCVSISWRCPGSGGALHPVTTYQADVGTITITSNVAPMGSAENLHLALRPTAVSPPPVSCMHVSTLAFATN